VRAKAKYGPRNIPQRATAGKAAQDAAGNYFSVSFSQNCLQRLEPWLVENMPLLRKLHFANGYSGRMGSMWMRLRPNCLIHLTHLNLVLSQDYTVRSPGFVAPNLRYARVEGLSHILECIEAPNLACLAISHWYLRDITILGKYPVLKDLLLERIHNTPYEGYNFRHEAINRVFFSTKIARFIYEPADYSHFLSNIRKHFPNVTSWHVDHPTVEKIISRELVPELDFGSLTSLALLSDTRFFHRPGLGGSDYERISACATYWKRLPNLSHLTVTSIRSYHEAEFLVEMALYAHRYQESYPLSESIVDLVRSLGTAPILLPSLQKLVLQGLMIAGEALSPLVQFLRSRNEEAFGSSLLGQAQKGRSQGIQLVVRNCTLEVLHLKPRRSFEVHELILSTFFEFNRFVTLLDGYGFLKEPEVT